MKHRLNKNRIGWLVLALLQLVLLPAAGAYWCVYTLAAQLMSTVLLTGLAGVAAKGVCIEIEKTETAGKGQDAGTTRNTRQFGFRLRLREMAGTGRSRVWRFLPARVVATYEVENLLTGEQIRQQVFLKTGPMAETEAEIAIDSLYCGKTEFTVSGVDVTDIFGLVCFSPAHADVQKSSVLLIPETYPVRYQRGRSALLDLDGSVYSAVKPGFDRSEVFSIREYREGDSPGSIHWKLTSKTDTVMIREGSLPVKNSLLILMETCFGQEERDLGARSQRTVAAALSLSESLLDEGIGHHLGWWDCREQVMRLYEIGRIEDLLDILGRLLSALGQCGDKTVTERYDEELGAWRFSHVAVVEDEIKDDMQLFN